MPDPSHPSQLPPLRGLDRRSIFIPLFTLLCIAFVPVVLYFVVVVYISPVSGFLANFSVELLHHLRHGFDEGHAMAATYLLLYTLLFIAAGFVIHRVAMKIRHPALRQTVLSLFLAIPFCCSFARVNTYTTDDIFGPGPKVSNYTFWEAIHRFREKNRLP